MTSVLLSAAPAESGGGDSNFLLPNGTFFVELLIFAIVFLVFRRWIVPPLAKAMKERDDMIRKQAEDREESARRLRQAEQRYQEALAEARGEAARIRDEARADAQRIRDEMREQADQEVARIHADGERQLAAQREQAVAELRGEIGGLADDLAARIVGRQAASTGTTGSVGGAS
ncbi:F0F1 ATP synthase subunit B [Pseudonocardia sp.]|uniref:F0F1 ATP synthase subunit B n=1 Tax=Pseudonocardia sp. TaxID=60912 RepID=UPI003D12BB06